MNWGNYLPLYRSFIILFCIIFLCVYLHISFDLYLCYSVSSCNCFLSVAWLRNKCWYIFPHLLVVDFLSVFNCWKLNKDCNYMFIYVALSLFLYTLFSLPHICTPICYFCGARGVVFVTHLRNITHYFASMTGRPQIGCRIQWHAGKICEPSDWTELESQH